MIRETALSHFPNKSDKTGRSARIFEEEPFSREQLNLRILGWKPFFGIREYSTVTKPVDLRT
jgi:hypothetical protein